MKPATNIQPQPISQPVSRITSALVFVLVLLIRSYQVCIRPFLIGSCKFCPSCSDYAIEAIQKRGVWRGGWLGVTRIIRCHPFSMGGIDPVPPKTL